MIQASAELVRLLNSSDTFRMADLYTFTLKSGTVLRYTDADIDVEWEGNLYKADELLITRGSITTSVGLEVDEMQVNITALTTGIIANGMTFYQMLTKGLFDNAGFTVNRAFFSEWGKTPVGVIKRFSGRVSDIEFSRSQADLTVSSYIKMLDIAMPRNLFETSCNHTPFSAGCGLNKANWGVGGSVQSGSTKSLIKTGIVRDDEDYFTLGMLTFTTGLNAGISRTIKSYNNKTGEVVPVAAFPAEVSIGDTFMVYAGCDRTMDCCKKRFNNLANFRGFPFTPIVEDVI